MLIRSRLARDVAKIQTAVRGLRTERHFPAGTKTSWLVVFPEGTRITRRALVASQRFMAEQGLAPPDRPLRHLLCPRFKGTQMILKEARGTFTAVYDVTIGYKPLPAHNNWRMPKEVHVHLKRIPMDSIGLTDAEVKSWLLGRWRTKDELLQHFYTHGSFPGTSAVHGSGLARTVVTLCGTVALNLVLTLGWWRIMRRLVTKLLLLRRR
jgi:lysocardiolipin and lysophospholipid acyltransferase